MNRDTMKVRKERYRDNDKDRYQYIRITNKEWNTQTGEV